MREGFIDARFEAEGEGFPGAGYCPRSRSCDALGCLTGFREKFLGVMEGVDQAPGEGGCSVDGLSCEHQLPRPVGADEPCKPLCAAEARDEAERGFGQAEPG